MIRSREIDYTQNDFPGLQEFGIAFVRVYETPKKTIVEAVSYGT